MNFPRINDSSNVMSKATGVSIAALLAVSLVGSASAQTSTGQAGPDADTSASCDMSTLDAHRIWAEIEDVKAANGADIVVAEDCVVRELWVNSDIKTAVESNDTIARELHALGYDSEDIVGVKMVSRGRLSIFVSEHN